MYAGQSHVLFTSLLIERLRYLDMNNARTTYKALVHQLSPPGARQHPRCIGLYKDRYLWSLRSPGPCDHVVHDIRQAGEEFHVYCLHSIRLGLGAVFEVYTIGNDDSDTPGVRCGEVVTVAFIADADSDMYVCKLVQAPFDLPQSRGIARLSEWTIRPKVFVEESAMALRFATECTEAMVPEDNLASAELSFAFKACSGVLCFEITRHDPFLRAHANEKVYLQYFYPGAIAGILEMIARFTFHLYRMPKTAPGWDVRVRLRKYGLNPPRFCLPAVWRDEQPVEHFNGPYQI